MSTHALLKTSDGASWTGATSGDIITICGKDYRLTFTKGGCDGPCLTLTSIGSGAKTFTTTRGLCGDNFAEFSIGSSEVCLGDYGCGGPGGNLARIRIAYTSCGYKGAGWYCVQSCTDASIHQVELDDSDASDPDIIIISGPYNTRSDAGAACPLDAVEGGTCEAPGTALQLDTWYKTSITITYPSSHGKSFYFGVLPPGNYHADYTFSMSYGDGQDAQQESQFRCAAESTGSLRGTGPLGTGPGTGCLNTNLPGLPGSLFFNLVIHADSDRAGYTIYYTFKVSSGTC